MLIRNATYHDAPAIRLLMEALGYSTRLSLLINRLETKFRSDEHQVFVCERHWDVIGFAAIHQLPLLEADERVQVITHLIVKEPLKNAEAAKKLEEHIARLAINNRCEYLHVHSLDWRQPGDQFYKAQGYTEYPKYLIKHLVLPEID